ncbi:hypothetical protein D4R87_01995 [bacterium]|nr:MAG: hypothetical protein D4R87_01995 [bacterium]
MALKFNPTKIIVFSVLIIAVLFFGCLGYYYLQPFAMKYVDNYRQTRTRANSVWYNSPDPDIKVNSRQIDFVKRQLKKLSQDSNALETRITDIEDAVPELRDQLTIVAEQSFKNESAISILQTDQSAIAKKQDETEKRVNKLESRVSGLQIVTSQLLETADLKMFYITCFGSGDIDLSETGKKEMARIVKELKKELQGHVISAIKGSSGGKPDSRDKDFGIGRATTVKSALIKAGIPISCEVSYGGRSESGDLNFDRRVTIVARRIKIEDIPTTPLSSAPTNNSVISSSKKLIYEEKTIEEKISSVKLFQKTGNSPARQRRIERRKHW